MDLCVPSQGSLGRELLHWGTSKPNGPHLHFRELPKTANSSIISMLDLHILDEQGGIYQPDDSKWD
jgi:hypothetical protein